MKWITTSLLTLTSTLTLAQSVPLKQEIKFTRACEAGEAFLVAAVGDILLHGPLQKKAAARQSFESLWDDAIPYIKGADLAYANLEGPAARGVNAQGQSVTDPGWVFDQVVYSSYPMFNYHPRLVGALKDSGFDIVSTANNHSLDRHQLGVDRTIEALEEEGLPFSGTRKRGETEKTRSWVTLMNNGNLKTAWIACTFSTNGIPDKANQVLDCYKSKTRILELVKEYSKKVDAVIVTPHWGDEYVTQPNANQVSLGRDLIKAGALAVIGNHPHVVQPMEKVLTAEGKEGFLIYSLGNFVSNQGEVNKRATGILYLGLTKNKQGTFLNGIKILGAYMENRAGQDAIELTILSKPAKRMEHEGAKHLRSVFADSMLAWKDEEIVPNSHCL